jgi:hypothetical protein
MSEPQRLAMAAAARRRVLAEHTAEHRAQQLETYVVQACEAAAPARRSAANRAVPA